MTSQFLSERDYELISAYLDGEVDARQLKTIEMRLAQDAQFRSAYEHLSKTRALLRSQPLMRAPRNYTLSPQSVQSQSQQNWRIFPLPLSLRAVSALASILFVVLFAMNWISMGRQMSAAAPQASEILFQASAPEAIEEQPVSKSTPAEEQPQFRAMPTSPATPGVIYPPASDVGGMGGGEAAGEQGVIEAPLMEPYNGSMLLTGTITSTIPISPVGAVDAVEVEDITVTTDLEAQMEPASDQLEPPSFFQRLERDWLVKQIVYGLLAISFALIAFRSKRRSS